jgi:3-dehydroquinate synthase
MTHRVLVHLKDRSYPVLIGPGALKDLSQAVRSHAIGEDAIVITIPKLQRLYPNKIKRSLPGRRVEVLTVPDSEASKSAGVAFDVIERISKMPALKRPFLIAWGGGVVGDLTGFVASIYKRGIPYVQVPTTLLAQVDSSIGGKTALDTPFAKNLIGAFHQPRLVVTDTLWLTSLTEPTFREGLSEVVKYALIKDLKLLKLLERERARVTGRDPALLTQIITRCIRAKTAVVEKDEFDKKDVRIALNFGHTFGHAFEAASHLAISHGQAVGLGMACACDLSRRLNLLEKKDHARALSLLETYGLIARPKKLKTSRVIIAMTHDKKFTKGRNRFVLLKGLGRTCVKEGIAWRDVREAILSRLTASA